MGKITNLDDLKKQDWITKKKLIFIIKSLKTVELQDQDQIVILKIIFKIDFQIIFLISKFRRLLTKTLIKENNLIFFIRFRTLRMF